MTGPIELESVQVGLLGIPDDHGMISGLLLVFNKVQDLTAFFGAVLNYFESPPGATRTFETRFTDSPATLEIAIDSLELSTFVRIEGIESQIAPSLVESLRVRPYYFILGAVRSTSPEGFTLPELDGHFVFKGDLSVDGMKVMGNQKGYWPPANPLKSAFSQQN